METIENSPVPQPVETIQQVPVEPKKKSNLPVIIILLIAILLVGVGGVYAGMQLSKKQTPTPLVSQPTVIPTSFVRPTTVMPTSISTSDTTANWKTYINTSYNFSFKYPSNFVYEVSNFDSTEDVSVKENDKLQFQVKGMKSYPPGQKDYLLDTTSNGQKTISNIVWKTFSLPKGYCDMGGCTLPIFGLQTEHNGALYSIYFYGQSSENEFSDQILSTFKFTK